MRLEKVDSKTLVETKTNSAPPPPSHSCDIEVKSEEKPSPPLLEAAAALAKSAKEPVGSADPAGVKSADAEESDEAAATADRAPLPRHHPVKTEIFLPEGDNSHKSEASRSSGGGSSGGQCQNQPPTSEPAQEEEECSKTSSACQSIEKPRPAAQNEDNSNAR